MHYSQYYQNYYQYVLCSNVVNGYNPLFYAGTQSLHGSNLAKSQQRNVESTMDNLEVCNNNNYIY
jgi:hypothetical protein